ncbi:MAG: hypothetical protein BJ554DRAFT_2987, partial [Olpidium bornovanus]
DERPAGRNNKGPPPGPLFFKQTFETGYEPKPDLTAKLAAQTAIARRHHHAAAARPPPRNRRPPPSPRSRSAPFAAHQLRAPPPPSPRTRRAPSAAQPSPAAIAAQPQRALRRAPAARAAAAIAAHPPRALRRATVARRHRRAAAARPSPRTSCARRRRHRRATAARPPPRNRRAPSASAAQPPRALRRAPTTAPSAAAHRRRRHRRGLAYMHATDKSKVMKRKGATAAPPGGQLVPSLLDETFKRNTRSRSWQHLSEQQAAIVTEQLSRASLSESAASALPISFGTTTDAPITTPAALLISQGAPFPGRFPTGETPSATRDQGDTQSVFAPRQGRPRKQLVNDHDAVDVPLSHDHQRPLRTPQYERGQYENEAAMARK